MNEEKQIEEMEKILEEGEHIITGITDFFIKTKFASLSTAKKLYNAGYRKQIEGQWEKRTFIFFDVENVGFKCSKCNTTWDTPTKFCPYCGARMKGGAE